MAAQQQRPLIFAHRGASAYAPENTLAAFELAIQQKADLIELDAKLSADQRVVIIHDRTLERTTNGYGRVEDHTYAELQKFNASYTFQEQFPNEKIPLLEKSWDCAGEIFRLIMDWETTIRRWTIYPKKFPGLLITTSCMIRSSFQLFIRSP